MSFLQLRTYKLDRALDPTLPSVTTNAASALTNTTATGNGSLDSMGGTTVTEMGFVWSTSVNPTTSDSKVTASVALGAYTGSITGLTLGTLYHYRAYATNASGTAYGADTTFTTTGAGAAVQQMLTMMGVGS